MRVFKLTAGYGLLIMGLIWIAVIMGGVFSQAEGFTSLNLLWGGFAFHAVCTAAGVWLVGSAMGERRRVRPVTAGSAGTEVAKPSEA